MTEKCKCNNPKFVKTNEEQTKMTNLGSKNGEKENLDTV